MISTGSNIRPFGKDREMPSGLATLHGNLYKEGFNQRKQVLSLNLFGIVVFFNIGGFIWACFHFALEDARMERLSA